MYELEALIEQRIEAGVPLSDVEALVDELVLGEPAVRLKLYAWAWRETKPRSRWERLWARAGT
jgi:hypothetical protein